jgi:hypothetical protein
MRGLWRAGLCALLFTGVTASGGEPPESGTLPIATIDFYGQRIVDLPALRKTLPIHEGDPVSMGDEARLTLMARTALSALPHVRDARVTLVCCAQDGGMHVFTAVLEDSSPRLDLRSAPRGRQSLPDALVAQDAATERALTDAALSGHRAEDDSQGHALLTSAPAARALQEQRVALAAANLRVLRQVLRESADAQQRAVAARFLGYAPDMQAVTDDLVRAVTDPDPGVRSDALRALMVFARATRPPHIPYRPCIDLLDSPEWSDLNRTLAALEALSASRDLDLLDLLRRRAMPALVAVARWHSREYRWPAYAVLGRIGGLSDEKIQSYVDQGDPEPVIAAALQRPVT